MLTEWSDSWRDVALEVDRVDTEVWMDEPLLPSESLVLLDWALDDSGLTAASTLSVCEALPAIQVARYGSVCCFSPISVGYVVCEYMEFSKQQSVRWQR